MSPPKEPIKPSHTARIAPSLTVQVNPYHIVSIIPLINDNLEWVKQPPSSGWPVEAAARTTDTNVCDVKGGKFRTAIAV